MSETVAYDWFRQQLKQYIIGIRADGMKKAQVRQVVIVVGYRLYDDVIAGMQVMKNTPGHGKNFAVVKSERGMAVHFEGAAVMAGTRSETIKVPDPNNPAKRHEIRDPGYIHPWSYRVDYFPTHKNGKKVKRIKPVVGKIVLCPEDKRVAHECD